MTLADTVPDAKTIWAFAEQLKNLGLEQQLFNRFGAELDRQGFAANPHILAQKDLDAEYCKLRIMNYELRYHNTFVIHNS